VAWFFRKTKIPELSVLEEEVLASSEKFSKSLKRKIKLLDFGQSWELTKKILPQVDKTKARSLVRLLFSDQTAEVVKQLEHWQEVNHAILCLEYLPSRETVEVLVELLSHQDKTIQLISAGALKNHTPRLVVPCLIDKLLKGEAPPARAGEVLLAMGYLAQDALLEAYGWAEPQIKAQILELLTISHNPKCQSFLGPALRSGEPLLRKAALQAVSVFLLRDLWSEVALCLTDPVWSIRVKSLEVLTKFRAVEALEMVRPLLEDEDPWVRKTAATCLEVLETG
jgi:HEAT repeat protein